MGYRLSKIYTRTGDDGKTQVSVGERILKNHILIETLGTLDELNCAMGLTLSFPIQNPVIKTCFTQIQHTLFDIGGELCPPHGIVIVEEKISALENQIDEWNTHLPPLKEFLLPGGNPASAHCHLARAICRRAERCLVTLLQEEPINPAILRYLNRLSDLLFVAARVLAAEDNQQEILWDHVRKKDTGKS
jgi:cob(I)alamin adenosyltransferase